MQAFMARIRHLAEQIIDKLREAEVVLGQGLKVPEVSTRLVRSLAQSPIYSANWLAALERR
ncbi:MAG: hypothetical protein AAGB34_02715 [Planctomycetota bacterium]